MRDLLRDRFFLAYLCLGIPILFYVAFSNVTLADHFWHLAQGKDWIEKGWLPTQDHYSFTFHNETIAGFQGGYQILVYLFYQIFGLLVGYQVLLAALWSAIFVSTVYLFKLYQPHRLIQIYLLAVLIFSFAQRGLLRPETLTLLFLSGALILWSKFLETRNNRILGWLCLFQFIWTNFDFSAFFGYLLFFAYGAQELFRSIQTRNFDLLRIPLIVAIIVFLIGFLNPSFSHPLWIAFSLTSQDWNPLILEYTHKSFFDLSLTFQTFWIFTLLVFIYSIIKKDLFGIIVLFVVAYQTWQLDRLFPFLVLFVALVVIRQSGQFSSIIDKNKRLASIVMYLALIFPFINLGQKIQNSTITQNIHSRSYPKDMLRYLEKNQVTGKILNNHRMGGLLAFQFSGRTLQYIDGRTNILYPIEHMKTYLNLRSSANLIQKEDEKYKFDYIVQSESSAEGRGIINQALSLNQFNLVYAGNDGTVLKRGENSFKFLTYFFTHPQCLTQNNLETKKSQLAQETESLTFSQPYSRIDAFKKLIETRNFEKLFERASSIDSQYGGAGQLWRLGFYLASSLRDVEWSIRFFNKIDPVPLTAQLKMAELFLKKGDSMKAKQLLDPIQSKNPPKFMTKKIAQIYRQAGSDQFATDNLSKCQFN